MKTLKPDTLITLHLGNFYWGYDVIESTTPKFARSARGYTFLKDINEDGTLNPTLSPVNKFISAKIAKKNSQNSKEFFLMGPVQYQTKRVNALRKLSRLTLDKVHNPQALFEAYRTLKNNEESES